jgi:VWFA-related protein
MPGDLRPRRVAVTLVGVSVAACLAIVAARAQSPAQQPTFRNRVDVVRLDVAVVDKERHPVRGLTAADFTVLEDGKPARIVDVVPVELPKSVTPATPWLREIAPDVATNTTDVRRLVVILFDDANTGGNYSKTSGPFRDPWIGTAGKDIARAVVDGLGPNDQAAVNQTFMGRRQNFTSDRAKLHKAIDSYVPQAGGRAGPPLGCSFRGVAGCVLDAFEQVAGALPETPPMRKAIVYISQGGGLYGFNADYLSRSSARADFASDQLATMQAVFKKLQQANTSIYAFSPGGLQVVSNQWTNDNLRMLADNTGGRAVVDTNAPWEGVPSVLEETSAYYLIGVQTAHQDGRFHKVKVQVNRPGVEARTRVGYYSPGPSSSTAAAAAAAADDTPIDAAITGGFPASDLALTAVALPFAEFESDRRARVLISTGLGAGAPGVNPVEVELVATAFDKAWKVANTERQTVSVTNVPGSHTEIPSTLRLAPGRYELRVGAAIGDRVGSVFLDLEIPNFARAPFSTSGLMLTTNPAIDETERLPAVGAVRPSVRRTFASVERVTAVWHLYQGGADVVQPVTVTMTMTDAQGRTVSTKDALIEAAQFDRQKSALYTSLLPLRGLAAGEYLLTMMAKAGARSETQNVRFRIN